MIESRTDIARAMIDATFVSRHRSISDIAEIRRDLDQSRRAVAASRDLLKRLRQRKIDEATRNVEQHPVSAFDADILRNVFQKLVLEMKTPECQWRDLAQTLVYDFTGCERVQSGVLDWIVRK
ncbi:hypothetical protein CK228_28440 [Mesorhizobium sp. WSM4312]|uniref:hypothetical protein n=1 Tax=unclassified Mesorhizobium TaxID=325217 RepID=UPI000BAEDD1B|nr:MULTISPECIES: hypothetical protein [unclassified Mesorhizobium]PBB65210.1 hypothetical protein CK228_28440 [Mesorhizobium sp. WSM4312]TRC78046.1 hypothetical protein FJV81_10750 [Mesorhizobium sp. WSM4315]TRC79235.1 hypothetical protein FJV83_28505 [Mesorhizobium sp. WSM4307]TRC80183.1 hypothetical protein FJV80_22670 [Mesorhizobium sp. WSM4310]